MELLSIHPSFLTDIKSVEQVRVRNISVKAIINSFIFLTFFLLRDSVSRALYDKMFTWIVGKLNKNITPESTKNMLSLGLLDIFGFENFELNSFEQLCINFANEKLQQLYINYVFKSEVDELLAEGHTDFSSSIVFNDNQSIIDLLSKPPLSVYDLIDESCALGNGSDDALLLKIMKQHLTNHLLS